VATVDSLIRASSSSLLQPLQVPGAFLGQVGPQPGVVAQLADLGGWDDGGAQHPPLVELGQPPRIELVGLGRPGTCWTSRALTSHTRSPWASSRQTTPAS